jgi:hypothetical protein
MPRLLWLCLATFIALPAYAQQTATLAGTVTDDAGSPLPGVNVFLAQTQRGTTTDAEGRYRLGRVPLGAHRLVASIVGYETAAQDLVLREPGAARTVDFRLGEAEYELGEVTVESTRDAEWQERYERFERRFIGETANAAETEILDPYVLDFDQRRGTLYAEAREPLVVENRGLGYRVRYDLTAFEARSDANFYDGEPLFEELEPADEAYLGSPRHLLRSLIAGNAEEQGFRLFLLPPQGPGGFGGGFGNRQTNRFPTSADEILERTDDGYRLEFVGLLEVVYLGEAEDPKYLDREWARERRPTRDVQTSQLRFPIAETAAELDRFGRELDPRSIVVSGYMAFERFADDLPREYGLAESGIPGAAEAVEALRETIE